MIIIYLEKPVAAQYIAPYIQDYFPGKKIVFISVFYFRNMPFQYPKNIAWSQFPYLQYPHFKMNDLKEWRPLLVQDKSTIEYSLEWSDVASCEELIYLGDPSYFSYVFSVFAQDNENVHSFRLMSYSEDKIKLALAHKESFYDAYRKENHYGEVISYFNYNFNFNSFSIFGKLLKQFEISDIGMSKYMLQLMYFLRDKKHYFTEGQLIAQMSQWRGTGKYTDRVSLGSPASQSAIIENLYSLGFLSTEEIEDKNYIYLTRRGEAFLSALPKDCIDQDLPFRLQHWAKEGLDISQDKIDNYLYAFFSKVKRRLTTHRLLGL